MPAAPREIGILKVAAIGDTLLISAIARDLRSAWPGARLTFFASHDNAAAAAMIADVDEVVRIPVTRPWRAAAELRRRRLDLLVDCGPWPRINAVIAATSGARFTVGFRTAGQHRHYAYDRPVDHSPQVHEVENYRSLVRALGVPAAHGPTIHLPQVEAPPGTPAGPFAVLHMWSAGTGGWQKEWPTERWAALAQELRDRGLQIVLTGGAGDRQRSAELVCSSALPGVVNMAGECSLAETAALLRRATLVISVNTGIMHLAALQGTPTISLDGPTPPHRWGPIGTRVRAVASRLPGCGFLNLGWEYAGQRPDCMQGIEVSDVVAAADELLAEAPRSPEESR